LRHLTAGLKVGDVALYPVDVVTFALAGGLPLADLLLIRIHAGRHHPIAGGSQLSADLGANAAVAPGNQRNTIRHFRFPMPVVHAHGRMTAGSRRLSHNPRSGAAPAGSETLSALHHERAAS